MDTLPDKLQGLDLEQPSTSRTSGVRLCNTCRNINWKLLRLPVASDIPLIQDYELPHRFPYISDADVRLKKVDLGNLADIKNRTGCELCTYISKYLDSKNVYTEDSKSVAGGGHVVKIRADIGRQHALFRYPDIDSYESVTLFRLSITTHLDGHPKHDVDNSAHLLLDNHFQVCDVGAGGVVVDQEFRDPRRKVDMALFGGRVRPQMLNIEWIKRWIAICEHEHDELCNSLLTTPDLFKMSHVRFIDVSRKCIVTVQNANLASIRYAALSYVWGAAQASTPVTHSVLPDLALTTANVEALHQPHSFKGDQVPLTIRDMLDLATALDVSYVWIDRLCIIQDDLNDKASQLGNMHAIYNAAYVAVIAAAGDDVHHGLPGLRPGSRESTQKEIVVLEPCASDCKEEHEHDKAGVSLLSCLEPYIRGSSYLEKANWSRRGWTMQERILARRSLIFTEQQVRFACANNTFSEDTYCEFPFPRMQVFSKAEGDQGLRSSIRTFAESGDPETRLWGQFKTLVMQYSTRLLTFGGDVHDAFAAITQALAIEAQDEFLWGIPLSQFEIGLSWKTFEGQHRRTDLTTLPMTDKHRRVPFPSWSWMGWVGQTSIAVGRERTETEKPTIECYIHAPDGKDSIKLDTIQHATPASKSWKPRYFPKFWKFHPERGVSVKDVKKELSDVPMHVLRDIPSNHLLFFWTASARFRVSRPVGDIKGLSLREPHLDFVCQDCYTSEQHMSGAHQPKEKNYLAREHTAPNIINRHGGVVGTLSRMSPEFWRSGGYDEGEHEFIVMARRSIPELEEFFPATLLVMQVERVDGIWYRVNMGEMAETDWNAANVEWKLIALG